MLLEVNEIDTKYDFLKVLWDVSLKVEKGEFIAIVGPNGAGKSTLLKSICGLLTPEKGEIKFDGKMINSLSASAITELGISYISEELDLFPQMKVWENLYMGAYVRKKDKEKRKHKLEFVYSLFPRLEERKSQLAGTLSGGERKMLAIARGIMSSPQMILVDEPSLGLAPQVTSSVFEVLQKLNDSGLTILMVEQNVNTTLSLTERAYVLEKGKIVLDGKSRDVSSDPHVKKAYLGL